MIDYSFIRLKPTLNEALAIGNSPTAQEVYNYQIQLTPCESFLQISNLDSGIAFDGDYRAELIDCEENVFADITSNFTIYEFIDKNGVNQIAFEFAKINVDLGFKEVLLRLTHTTGIDVYYSNKFIITNESKHETTRFDYKSYSYFKGISYDVVDLYQSIRLNYWFDQVENETEVSDYYQISNGNTVSNRALYKQKENYKSEYTNRFVYERSNIMLISDVIYIDGIRVTNKPQVTAGERLNYSNIFEGSFSCYKNYDDTYTPTYQITDELGLISYSPNGSYTLVSLPNEINGSFNRNVTLGSGTIIIRKASDNSIIQTFTENDVDLVDNSFTVDISGLITENDIYTVTISKGLFLSGCESFDGIQWSFSTSLGSYNNTQYKSTQYFTD